MVDVTRHLLHLPSAALGLLPAIISFDMNGLITVRASYSSTADLQSADLLFLGSRETCRLGQIQRDRGHDRLLRDKLSSQTVLTGTAFKMKTPLNLFSSNFYL